MQDKQAGKPTLDKLDDLFEVHTKHIISYGSHHLLSRSQGKTRVSERY